jgi:predicted MFS family arabinose efflux permease
MGPPDPKAAARSDSHADAGPGAPPATPPTRLFTPAFIALSVAELAYFTAAGLSIPVTPLFAAGPIGADPFGVGLAVGAFSLTALLIRPIAGQAADVRGRRPLLVGGALLFAAATAAHPLAENLAILVGLRLVLGVAEAFFFVAGFAALADLAPPGRAGEALSFNSLALYLGLAFGPLIGQGLIEIGGFTLAWLGGAGLALVAAGLAMRLPETADPGRDRTRRLRLVHPAVVAPGLALFTGIAAMAGFLTFVALHAVDVGLAEWSVVLLEFGLVVVGTRIVFATLPDRVPPFRLGAAALGLAAAGLVVTAGLDSVAGLLVGTGLIAAGVAFTTPAFFAAILGRVAAPDRGVAMGTASIFLDLAFGGGPLLFGLVAGAAGIPAAFLAGAAIALVGAAGALGLSLAGPARSRSAA